jgi:DNA (cytosine-5)-methyltransferase 1
MVDPIITSLGLCAGTGMLDYGLHIGLEYLGCQSRVLGYVERDAFAASNLLARMEDKAMEPVFVWAGNLEDVRFSRWHGCLDFIVAGIPCQPWSAAGKQAGTDDSRWIWPDIARGIRDAEPRLCWLENVRGLVSGGGLEFVLSDLACLGFDVEWGVIAASDVGASHERERVFILAYHKGERLAGGGLSESGGRRNAATSCGRGADVADSNCQSNWRLPIREESANPIHCQPSSILADASKPGSQRREQRRASGSGHGPAASRSVAELCEIPIFAPGPADSRWADIIERFPYIAPATESGVRGVVNGVAVVVDESKPDQLRCVGNGVVPLQAAFAFVTLARRAGIV